MILPDCRNDDSYNKDFLNKEYKSYLDGMDQVSDAVEDLFENNILKYYNVLTTVSDDEEFKHLNPTRDDLWEVLIENRKLIVYMIKDWLENQRNGTIVAMTEHMDINEYENLREKAFKDNPDKEYYDTVHYLITNEKKRAW